MGKNKSLIKQYEKYAKRGKTEKFQEYLKKEGLVQTFIKEVFNNTYGGYIPEEMKKRAMNLTNFSLDLADEMLSKKYGESLASRFKETITNSPHASERIFYIYSLSRWNIELKSQEEKNTAEEIFDIISKPGNVIGVHATGAEIGDTLIEEGILLTGHLEDKYSNKMVEDKLRKNVELFKSSKPLDTFIHIIDYRNYSPKPGTKCSDMMILSIPEEELQQNNAAIIGQGEFEEFVNPSYINGYVRIQREPIELEGFTKNPAFIEKSTNKFERLEPDPKEQGKENPNPIQKSIEGNELYKGSTQSGLAKIKAKIKEVLRSASQMICRRDTKTKDR